MGEAPIATQSKQVGLGQFSDNGVLSKYLFQEHRSASLFNPNAIGIRPVTVRQLREATQAHSGAPFKIAGVEVDYVRHRDSPVLLSCSFNENSCLHKGRDSGTCAADSSPRGSFPP